MTRAAAEPGIARDPGDGPIRAGLAGRLLGDTRELIEPALRAAIDGLPPGQSEDRLKAIGAAAASSGSVAMFHVVGSTPEAPTLDAALHGMPPERVETINLADLRAPGAIAYWSRRLAPVPGMEPLLPKKPRTEDPANRFGGWHPGVTLFLMGDGSVRAMNNDTNPYVLQCLGSRNDGSRLNLDE